MKCPGISRYLVFLVKNYRINLSCVQRSTYCHIHHNVIEDANCDDYTSSVDYTNENRILRGVPLSIEEYKAKKCLKPEQPENPHLLKVSLLGEPNVGKSLLTNSLMKWKVCAVSKKVHTTRQKTSAVYVEENKQIVFLDTPGFVTPEHSKKHNLEVSLVADPEKSVKEADLVAVVIDVSNKWTNKKINPDILRILNSNISKKTILVLNKVDVMKKKGDLLDITKILTQGIINGIPIEKTPENVKKKRSPINILEENSQMPPIVPLEPVPQEKGWPYFSEVFMVSALTGDGIDKLRSYLLDNTRPGSWMYHESVVTDSHPHQIACMIVREKLLNDLPDEIPYNLSFKVKNWDIDSGGCLRIKIAVICSKSRYKALLIGKSGLRVAKCVEESRQALQDTFRTEIYLKLAIVVPSKT